MPRPPAVGAQTGTDSQSTGRITLRFIRPVTRAVGQAPPTPPGAAVAASRNRRDGVRFPPFVPVVGPPTRASTGSWRNRPCPRGRKPGQAVLRAQRRAGAPARRHGGLGRVPGRIEPPVPSLRFRALVPYPLPFTAPGSSPARWRSASGFMERRGRGECPQTPGGVLGRVQRWRGASSACRNRACPAGSLAWVAPRLARPLPLSAQQMRLAAPSSRTSPNTQAGLLRSTR